MEIILIYLIRFYLNNRDDIYFDTNFTFSIFENFQKLSIIYLHIGNNSNLSYEISRRFYLKNRDDIYFTFPIFEEISKNSISNIFILDYFHNSNLS